jgi:hypothetical protein
MRIMVVSEFLYTQMGFALTISPVIRLCYYVCSFVCIAFCRGCLKCHIYRHGLHHIIFWTLKLKGNKVGRSVQDHCRAPIYTFCGGSTTSVHSWIKREVEAIGNPTLRQLSFPFSFYKFIYVDLFSKKFSGFQKWHDEVVHISLWLVNNAFFACFLFRRSPWRPEPWSGTFYNLVHDEWIYEH